MSPRDVANAMTEAVVEFAAKSPMHLHQITVCIYQSQMVQQFAAGVAYKASSSSWQQTVKGVVSSLFYVPSNFEAATYCNETSELFYYMLNLILETSHC